MDEIREALACLVRAGMQARELDEKLRESGYGNTPYSLIYGEIADAIYKITGEHTEMLSHSVTHTALNAPLLCEERRVAILMHAYRENHCQPRPHTFETDPEEVRRIARKQGGYAGHTSDGRAIYETPEGDWSR